MRVGRCWWPPMGLGYCVIFAQSHGLWIAECCIWCAECCGLWYNASAWRWKMGRAVTSFRLSDVVVQRMDALATRCGDIPFCCGVTGRVPVCGERWVHLGVRVAPGAPDDARGVALHAAGLRDSVIPSPASTRVQTSVPWMRRNERRKRYRRFCGTGEKGEEEEAQALMQNTVVKVPREGRITCDYLESLSYLA